MKTWTAVVTVLYYCNQRACWALGSFGT